MSWRVCVAVVGLCCAPAAAASLEARAEAGVGRFLLPPQSERFGFSAPLLVKAFARFDFPIAPLVGGGVLLAPSALPAEPGVAGLTLLGAGLRLHPISRGLLRGAFLELQLDYVTVQGLHRVGGEAALGFELALFSGRFSVGPCLRYVHVVQPDTEVTPQDVTFLSVGLSLGFGVEVGARPAEPVPAPLAPPPASPAPPAPPAPPPAPPPPAPPPPAPPPDAGAPAPATDDPPAPKLRLIIKPPPDADGDGFPDERDRCPAAAETFNGVLDDDGCPDVKAGPELARVVEGRLEVLAPVELDERLRLRPRSRALVAAVARLLALHVELVRLEVEARCGSDPDGRRGIAAAESVRAGLLETGLVDAARVDATSAAGEGPGTRCTVTLRASEVQ